MGAGTLETSSILVFWRQAILYFHLQSKSLTIILSPASLPPLIFHNRIHNFIRNVATTQPFSFWVPSPNPEEPYLLEYRWPTSTPLLGNLKTSRKQPPLLCRKMTTIALYLLQYCLINELSDQDLTSLTSFMTQTISVLAHLPKLSSKTLDAFQ